MINTYFEWCCVLPGPRGAGLAGNAVVKCRQDDVDRERGSSQVPMPKVAMPKMALPKVTTWQLSAGSAAIGLALAAALIAASGPWDSGQRTAERDWAAAETVQVAQITDEPPASAGRRPRPALRAVLAALGERGGTQRDGLAQALGPLLGDPALGTGAPAW